MPSNFVYVRWRPGQPREGRVMFALPPTHPCAGVPCHVCGEPLDNGLPVRPLVLGPDDSEARAAGTAGKWFPALGVLLHSVCLGIDETPAKPGAQTVVLSLSRVDAGNLEAMVYAGYRKLRDDDMPEATAMARDVLNQVLAAIKPLQEDPDDSHATPVSAS